MLSYLFTRGNKTFLLVVECKADLIHNFSAGMKCFFPEYRKGLTKWKAEIGIVSKISVVKLFSLNVAFRRDK